MKKAIIIYETETGNTEAIAKILESQLKTEGLDIISRRISKANDERFDLIRAINPVDVIIIGSPTRYSRILDSVQEFLTELGRANYMGRINLSIKTGVAFGSYGWSGSVEGVKFITDILKEKVKMKVIEPGLLIKGKPSGDTIEECRNFAILLAEKIKNGL
jgi:flavorubredoxin